MMKALHGWGMPTIGITTKKKKIYNCEALVGVDMYGKKSTWYTLVNAFLSLETRNKGQFLNHSSSLHLFSLAILHLLEFVKYFKLEGNVVSRFPN